MVSFKIGSSEGCKYSTFLGLRLRSINSSTIPESRGPGRYNATIAMMSSKLVGPNLRRIFCMPLLSSWNTPIVSAFCKSLYVFASSRGIAAISIAMFLCFLISFIQVSMMVRLANPKKSIFTSPAFSRLTFSYCDEMLPSLGSRYNGTCSINGSREMTTPAACFPAERVSPSTFFAIVMSCLPVSFVLYNCFNSSEACNASSRSSWRINFVRALTCCNGISRARATSRIAPFDFILLKVIIWLTWSSPYFCFTYSMTSSRRNAQKSISISGISLRSGFKNRSKSRLYFIGSSSVISRQYDTIEPAAEPRPGPTGIPCCFANCIKSHTTRKYPENCIRCITDSSYSIRFFT